MVTSVPLEVGALRRTSLYPPCRHYTQEDWKWMNTSCKRYRYGRKDIRSNRYDYFRFTSGRGWRVGAEPERNGPTLSGPARWDHRTEKQGGGVGKLGTDGQGEKGGGGGGGGGGRGGAGRGSTGTCREPALAMSRPTCVVPPRHLSALHCTWRAAAMHQNGPTASEA